MPAAFLTGGRDRQGIAALGQICLDEVETCARSADQARHADAAFAKLKKPPRASARSYVG